MKILISSFSFLLSSLALASVADFTGTWVGKATITSTFGVKGSCSSLEIDIRQTATAIVVTRYHAACDLMDTDWGPSTMQIKGGKLIEDGEEVGSIDESTMVSNAADSGVLYILNLKKISDTEIDSTYGTKNAVGTISVDGPLKRK